MDKIIAQKALEQYLEIKSIFEENKDKTIDELYDIYCEKYYNNVFNFDGELFDVGLDYVAATIFTVNGNISLMNRFDVYVGDSIETDYTIEELKEIIA